MVLKYLPWLVLKTFYTMSMKIYTGKQPESSFKVKNSEIAIVNRLVQLINGKKEQTSDNRYMSILLAE